MNRKSSLVETGNRKNTFFKVNTASDRDLATQEDSIEEYERKTRKMAETIKQSSKTNRITKNIDIGRSMIAEPNMYKSTYLGKSNKYANGFGVRESLTQKTYNNGS